jgi:hydrogenase maturation protease
VSIQRSSASSNEGAEERTFRRLSKRSAGKESTRLSLSCLFAEPGFSISVVAVWPIRHIRLQPTKRRRIVEIKEMSNHSPKVMILGVGCILYSDEGFGVRVVQEIQKRYAFSENVSVVDGGVLGVNLLGVISQPDHLIVVDVIRNKGNPGDLYRLSGKQIPERIRAKNSLHQVDFLEALTLCQALDKVPETVIVGVEPEDIETLSIELTPTTKSRLDDVIGMVLAELDHLGVSYTKGNSEDVPRYPI